MYQSSTHKYKLHYYTINDLINNIGVISAIMVKWLVIGFLEPVRGFYSLPTYYPYFLF